MRNINILTEDYIELEAKFGDIEQRINESLLEIKKDITNIVTVYENSDKGIEAYHALRYSKIFDEMANFDFSRAIQNKTKTIASNDRLPLEEAMCLSYGMRDIDGGNRGDEVENAVYFFGGRDNADIPELPSLDNPSVGYEVVYDSNGKNAAMRNCASMFEHVGRAYSALKSMDCETLLEALGTLAAVKVAVSCGCECE